jgi:ABC-2 type transport system permease protein
MSSAERADSTRRVWVVAARELRERGGTRGFRYTTLAVLLLIVAAIVLPAKLGGGTTSYEVGLAGRSSPSTVAALQAQANAVDRQVKSTLYASVAAGEQAVRDKTVDVLVVDDSRLEWRSTVDKDLAALVSNALQIAHVRAQASRLGITPAQLATMLTPVTITNRHLDTSAAPDEETRAVATLMVGALLLALSVYGSYILTGVVQEKSNRVAEVLLSRMPARELLTGKVLGIGALGLGQFALLAVTAAVSVKAVGAADAPDVAAGTLAWLVAWFVLGFAFYAVVYAAVGSLTSRLEDAQSAAMPLSFLLIVAFWATLFAAEDPGSGFAVFLSFLPVSAPLTMPVRIALDAAPVWQVVASAALTAGTTVVLVRAAGRIYSGALLRVGARVPLRDAWRSVTP